MRTPCDFVWAGVFTVYVCRMRIVEVCVNVRTNVCMCVDGQGLVLRAWGRGGGGRKTSKLGDSGVQCPCGQMRVPSADLGLRTGWQTDGVNVCGRGSTG